MALECAQLRTHREQLGTSLCTLTAHGARPRTCGMTTEAACTAATRPPTLRTTTTNIDAVKGDWKIISSSSGPQTVSYQLGVTRSEQVQDSQTWGRTVPASVEAGFTATVSGSLSSTLSEAYSSTFSTRRAQWSLPGMFVDIKQASASCLPGTPNLWTVRLEASSTMTATARSANLTRARSVPTARKQGPQLNRPVFCPSHRAVRRVLQLVDVLRARVAEKSQVLYSV